MARTNHWYDKQLLADKKVYTKLDKFINKIITIDTYCGDDMESVDRIALKNIKSQLVLMRDRYRTGKLTKESEVLNQDNDVS